MLTLLLLFLIKYIYIKLFFIEKFKILFKILCVVIIIFNFLSLKDLNHDKYYFQIQNFEVKKLSHYKKYFQKHYVNLYLSKDYDVSEYELCFEMLYPDNFSLIFKKELTYSPWEFTKKKDYFIGCRNVSFKDNPAIEKNQSLTFFKCDINEKNNVNVLPNYCISAKERRKKYDFIYKLNIYEFILLILCYIYVYLARYLFYKHHLYLSNGKYIDDENIEEGEECEEMEEKEEENAEGKEVEYEHEEEEYEEEEEEEKEENNWRRIKYRKISKKKMKYFKKKQKNRYRKYINNTNEEKVEENEQEKKENENEVKKEEIKNNTNDSDKQKNLNDDKLSEENKNEVKESNVKEKMDIKKNESEYIIENNKKEEIIKKNNNEEQENNKKENHTDNNDNNFERRAFRRNNFIYDLVLGGIVDRIKNKFYNILKQIDKDILEDEKNKEN